MRALGRRFSGAVGSWGRGFSSPKTGRVGGDLPIPSYLCTGIRVLRSFPENSNVPVVMQKLTRDNCKEKEQEKLIYHFVLKEKEKEIKNQFIIFILKYKNMKSVANQSIFITWFWTRLARQRFFLLETLKGKEKQKKCRHKSDDRMASKQQDVQNSIHFSGST